MMAKMFYTMEEAKATLGKSEEEVKQYAREGRLREFRDGPRLMFKADQVEQLKSELASGGGGTPDLGVSDSGGLIGLVDTTGASGTSITLSEADTGQSSVAGLGGLGGSASGLRLSGLGHRHQPVQHRHRHGPQRHRRGRSIGGGSASQAAWRQPAGMSGSGINLKGDTGLAADLGLSGSLGGVPSPGRPGGTGTGMAMSGTGAGRTGAGGGINVFGPDDDAGRRPRRPDRHLRRHPRTGQPRGRRLRLRPARPHPRERRHQPRRRARRDHPRRHRPRAPRDGRHRRHRRAPAWPASAKTAAAAAPHGGARRSTSSSSTRCAVAFGGAALAPRSFVLFGIYVLISALVGAHPDAVELLQRQGVLHPRRLRLGVVAVFAVLGFLAGVVGSR